ncbi:hypothetical protein [Mycolicibacterium sp.]|uniref:hypothetical protein n=1 Tax=Mycolicibacterium sp. TaxID=2320850 RepID=UPI0037C83BE3
MFDVIGELRVLTDNGQEPRDAVLQIGETLGYTIETDGTRKTLTQRLRREPDTTITLTWHDGELNHASCATGASTIEASSQLYNPSELVEIAVSWLADGVGVA